MSQRTDDLRIQSVRPLIPPAILAEELPITREAANVVAEARRTIQAALFGENRRFVAIVGPCSIHDAAAAVDYAGKLKEMTGAYSDQLLVVMRAYFEKPRTVVGWKGLINDPDLDGTYRINKGLRLARGLLLQLAEMQLPVGTEFLDTTSPQYTADLIAWGAIGARTSESQIHRELASGLSMPVGFKNGTSGNPQIAIDAVATARASHWFTSVTKQGISAISQSTGNDCCHVILRGGSRTGPNYSADFVAKVVKKLVAANMPPRLMVDCSHANSLKDHTRQIEVAADVAQQIGSGSDSIFGVMVESNLVAGRQDCANPDKLVYGQSITDACLSIEDTKPILELLAEAVVRRG